jgi:hypothetical protein
MESQADDDSAWRDLDLDSETLSRAKPADLLNRLSNLSPDLSRAIWDFLRMSNPGWECQCFGSDGKTVDARAQTAIDAFIGRLNARYGSVDVVLHRLFITAFLRGGFFAELVLNKAGTLALDIATPDSRYLQFERVIDPELGPVWRPFQWQGGRKVFLDAPTVRYVPVDPLPGSPFGRAPAAPSLFTILFAMGLLHDLRRVVAQQGWPRLDLEISLEELLTAMPPEAQATPAERQAWLDEVVRKIQETYASLQPDDTYVHLSNVKINRPVGTVDSSSLGAVDGIMAALDRQAVRSLKSMPLLFGISDGVSEANANRQWEVHIAGLKALQHLCEGLLEHLLTLALQAEGLQAKVEWRFSEVRAAELLRDAQVKKLDLQNAAFAYWFGLISMDEAAMMALGREKADQEVPRLEGVGVQAAGSGGGATNPENVAADAGSMRARVLEMLREDEDALLPSANGNGHAEHLSR